jgi:hypothetical protein
MKNIKKLLKIGMGRKRMIKTVNALKDEGISLTGDNGAFAIVALFSGLSANTAKSYYYADPKRPKNRKK